MLSSSQRILLLSGVGLLLLAGFAGPAGAMGKPRVAALQIGLQAKGFYGGTIDGVLGPETRGAVRRLQRQAGIAVDGIPGAQTRRALGRYGRPGYGRRTLQSGHVGWDVSILQFLLAWHGFPAGTLDGAFGPRTAAAVARFQRFARLGVDGVPGPATMRRLRGPLPRSPLALRRPVPIRAGDGFGPRGNRFHTGVDFPARAGAPVRAAARGRVVFAGWDAGGYGRLVVLAHGRGTTTWYAHLNRIRVSRGRTIGAGARIGTVGSTGHSTGPHLHFEVRVRGAAVDPLPAFR